MAEAEKEKKLKSPYSLKRIEGETFGSRLPLIYSINKFACETRIRTLSEKTQSPG